MKHLVPILYAIVAYVPVISSFASFHQRTHVAFHTKHSLPKAVTFQLWSTPESSSKSATITKTAEEPDNKPPEWIQERNQLSNKLLERCRDVGQIGTKTSDESRSAMRELSNQLMKYSDDDPAFVQLTQEHELLYSESPGGSSGAIGPFVGQVTQKFVNEVEFVNGVSLGPLNIQLMAERDILDSGRIKVEFRETVVKFLGLELVRKETNGKGVWQQLFVGVVPGLESKDERILLRVMLTPSLFIIQQKL